MIAAPWCAAHAVPARACARCTGARAPLCSVRAAPPVRKRVQRAPIDAPPRAGIPAGVVTELLLRVDPLLPARPRTDYDVVAHALQGAGGPVRSRVCVIEAGDLFSVASLEKALQAHPQINLQAALDAVDIRRAGDLATLGVCVQQLCLSAAGHRAAAVPQRRWPSAPLAICSDMICIKILASQMGSELWRQRSRQL